MARRESKEPPKPSKAWLETYGDMITLMLCFFVMLFNPTEIDEIQLAQLTVALQGDPTSGGMSLAAGRLADLGNTITSLPSLEKGKSLGLAVKKAVSIFSPEINSNKIKASDALFRENSAELLIDETRETLLKLAQFLNLSDLKDRRFRIEGHTDSIVPDPALWPSNWELSAARAVNVLHYLADFGADERRFSVAGYGNTQPQFAEDMPERRAYNRRVDIIILDEGHF